MQSWFGYVFFIVWKVHPTPNLSCPPSSFLSKVSGLFGLKPGTNGKGAYLTCQTGRLSGSPSIPLSLSGTESS